MSLKLSIPEEIAYLESEFDNAFDHTETNRRESDRAWSAYTGFDNGQWPKEAVSNLKKQNRHIVQYNYIRGKIDGLAGNITATEMDVDFVPVESEYSDLTRTIKNLYYSDKELMDWGREFTQCVIDGLVFQGVEQIVISDRYSALGNIGFERIQPGNIILDPQWKSHNAADLTRAWKVSYMTADKMKTIYNAKADRIDQLVALHKLHTSDYQDDESSDSLQYAQLSESYGDLYRVIEHHYLEDEVVYVDIVINQDDVEMVIPENIPEDQRKTFLKENQIKPKDIIRHRKVKRVYKIKTTCMQLAQGEFLEDAPASIQIDRLPFFPWSAARINGHDSGMVELLIDAQQTLNKRESLADHIISSSAHGAKMIDPAVVNNDANLLSEFVDNIDKPNATLVTAPGALASGRRYTQLIEKAQYQGEIYQDITRMVGAMDVISRQTAAMSGVNENAHETGTLFARKQQQGEIAMSTLMQSVDQHWNDKAEAYMSLAKGLYSGVYREFRMDFMDSTKQELITLNDVGYTPDGERVITNDLALLPRHKVILSKSPHGVTMRLTDRAVNVELMSALPETAYLSRAQVTKNIMMTLDMSDEDKAKMMEATDLEYENAFARMTAEIAQQQAIVDQTKQQTQQVDQQMAMQKMMMQEGKPPEEGTPQGQPDATPQPPQ